ncbi:MAG: zinc-dependent peptidase [Leptothrix sp. (in: b-proteobacteria)]
MALTLPYGTIPMLLVLATSALAVGRWVTQTARQERRRARVRSAPFPAAWRRILRRRVPLVARLPAELQLRLKRHIQVFLAEKPFIGCDGQPITDEVRVTVAAQACLLLLGSARPDCYPRLRQVLVYPGSFTVTRDQPLGAGLVQVQRQALAGESWTRGEVILSWPDVVAGAADASDGQNVTLHEFAHQIDQDSGVANGQPWRPGARQRQRWAAVMGAALARLRERPHSVINRHGAIDPAEFFAEASVAFFERSTGLLAEEPALYRELAALFGVDPAGPCSP